MLIEDIFENKILEWLSYIYNKSNDISIIYIFYLRACIYYNKEKISTEELTEFLLKELNLPDKLYFDNIEISTSSYYKDNSLLNIVDNLIFRFLERPYNDVRRGLITGKEFILELFKSFIQSTRNKLRGIKYSDKQFLRNYFMLEMLYDEFQLTINPPKLFQGINYPKEHNNFNPTFDEIALRHFNFYIQEKEKPIEKNLEDYICKNGLFDDIKILNRQVKIEHGIIDLIGIDNNNTKIMIELKVTSKPRDLLWQINLYQNDLKKQFKNQHFRIMVVSPPLDESIKSLLPDNCEIVEFKKYKSKYTFKKVR